MATISERFKRLIMHEQALQIHDLDSSKAYDIHRDIILSSPFLQNVYRSYFEELLKDFNSVSSKKIVEIGAGAYNCSDYYKGIITSNTAENNFTDILVDAQKLPFGDGELDGIVMLNTLHHIPKPKRFFNEVSRTLKRDGMLAMVEPYYSILGKFIWKNLHEPSFETSKTWELPIESNGKQTYSNQIMPYHVFFRDIKLFQDRYPELKIQRITIHNCIAHLLSGGITYKSFVPGFMERYIWRLETLLKPFRKYLAMYMTVVIRKESSA